MSADFDFSGYRVLVSGGSRGIGLGIAQGFARAGADLSICARGAEGLTRARQLLAEAGGRVHTHAADLSDADAVQGWVEDSAKVLGGIDVLVNNAPGYGFDDRDDGSWRANFDTDVMAAVRASRAAEPHLDNSGHASIIHISSIAALSPRPQGAPYGAMKAALDHYTRSQALALAGKGIRVNAIAPGSIEFEDGVWDRVRREDPKHYETVRTRIPFGRYGTPENIARVALFLASPAAAWVTGQIIAVDGGQSLNG